MAQTHPSNCAFRMARLTVMLMPVVVVSVLVAVVFVVVVVECMKCKDEVFSVLENQ